MKTVRIAPFEGLIGQASVWCREQGIPVVFLAFTPDYDPFVLTARYVARHLGSGGEITVAANEYITMIVRDRDYELVRLRF